MKKVFTIVCIVFVTHTAFTQGPPLGGPPDEEKIESLRIAFLTNYLSLTPEEGQKFWPVYNQMRDELKVYMDKELQLRKDKNINSMSDADLNQMIQEHFDNEQQLLNIKKKYADEFKKVLPLRKVALLADAENEFKRKLLEAAKDRNKPGDDGPGGRFRNN